MRLCIVGGSPSNPGGLEAFCARAVTAFRQTAPQVAVDFIPTESSYIRPRGLLRMIGCARTVVLRRKRYDVVWVQVSNMAECLFVLLARALGLRVLATPHLGANSRMQTIPWVRRTLTAMLGRAHGIGLLFSGQEREIALPAHLPQTVIGTFLPEHVFRPLPAPCAQEQPVPDPPEQAAPLRLIHAARFSEAKGSLLMLDLCARLKREGVPFAAKMVGRGDPAIMAQIERTIAQANMAQEVTLVNWLDEDGIAAALREADVLVHLSSIDSFPLIVLEALAADTLPIVRPMAGGLAMVTALGGYAARDTDPVESAFEWLSATPLADLREQRHAAGKRAREAYDWGKVVSTAIRALEGL